MIVGKSGSSHPSASFPSMMSSAKGKGIREEVLTIWGEKEKVGNNYLGKWERIYKGAIAELSNVVGCPFEICGHKFEVSLVIGCVIFLYTFN